MLVSILQPLSPSLSVFRSVLQKEGKIEPPHDEQGERRQSPSGPLTRRAGQPTRSTLPSRGGRVFRFCDREKYNFGEPSWINAGIP